MGALALKPFDHAGDICLSMWARIYGLGRFDFPKNGRVLEIGCAEADWISPMLASRPDLQITGIDWRPSPPRKPALVIAADVLKTEFAPESFDAIVGISSIEHIGLGHYNDDPIDVDGDRHCMQRVARWLAPGGWVYLDVPYDPMGYRVQGTKCRVYDEAAIASRLLVKGLSDADVWTLTPNGELCDPPTESVTPWHYAAIWAQKA